VGNVKAMNVLLRIFFVERIFEGVQRSVLGCGVND